MERPVDDAQPRDRPVEAVSSAWSPAVSASSFPASSIALPSASRLARSYASVASLSSRIVSAFFNDSLNRSAADTARNV